MNNDTTDTLITPAVRASAPVWLFDDNGRVWSLEEAREYIHARVEEDENGCWLWQSSVTKDGYGQITDDALYRTFGIKGAHRLSYFVHTGHKPTGRWEPVLHSCDVRSCCNPDHLDVGTPAENTRQMIERGRARWLRGDNHPKARLTTEAVRDIREQARLGQSQRIIAMEHNMSDTAISLIVNRKTWRHVD